MSVKIGLVWDAVGSVQAGRGLLDFARGQGLDAFLVFDHLINVFPRQVWDAELTPLAEAMPEPDQCLDFATVLGNFAPHAGPMQLIVAVTDPGRRHPAVLAQTALTLAQFTERAPVLGIGAGAFENLVPYGLPHDRQVERTEETLQILRMFFEGVGPHDFRGKHFTLDQALMGLRAPEGRTPEVWVGANGPRMLKLTGRYADGWVPSELVEPAEYGRRWGIVRDAAEAADRDPDAIVAAGGVPIVVADTDAEAHKLLQTKLIRYMALHASAASWRKLGYEHPFGPGYQGLKEMLPHKLTRAEFDRAMSDIPDEVVAAQAIVGSRETVLNRIGDLIDAGMRHPMLIPMSALASPDAANYTVETVAWLGTQLRATAAVGA